MSRFFFDWGGYFGLRIPGTQGQPHRIVPDAGFFMVEDYPQLLAETTLDFIRATA